MQAAGVGSVRNVNQVEAACFPRPLRGEGGCYPEPGTRLEARLARSRSPGSPIPGHPTARSCPPPDAAEFQTQRE